MQKRRFSAPVALGLSLVRQNQSIGARFLGCSVAQAGGRAATIWLIKEFLQTVLAGSRSAGALYAAGAAIFGAWTVTALFEYGSKVYQQHLMRRMEFAAMMRLVRHLLTLSVEFFDRSSHGDLLMACRGDVAGIRELVSAACTIIVSVLTFAALLVAAFSLSPELSFWGLVMLPLAAWPAIALGARIRRIAESRRRLGYKIYDILNQVFAGIRLVKIYQAEDREVLATERLGTKYYETLIQAMSARALAGVILESLAGFGVVVVVILGGLRVMGGELAWPSLLAFLMVLMSMREPLKQAVHAQAGVKEQAPGLARLAELLATQPEMTDSPTACRLKTPPEVLAYDQVSFRYATGARVLDDVSFEVRAGETIGIVGPSGAGKTTLLSLAARLFDPTGGRVTIDGVDLRQIRIADLMQQFALVTQDPFLFDATVRENILYGRPDASDAEVMAAAQAAAVHDEILALPQGYETMVGIAGVRLSGGQRQRVSVARALLKNSPILLLDEATSSLDSVAELKVQNAIDMLMQGRTSLVIAHRLSTLRHADRIVVLSAGRVEAVGRHDDLLTTNTTYRRLWETQSRMGRARASGPEPRRQTAAEPVG